MSYLPYGFVSNQDGHIVQVDHDSQKTHEGTGFMLSEVRSISTATYNWGLTAPNSAKRVHLSMELDGTGELFFQVLENPATFSGGVALPSFNRNRNSVIVSDLVILSGVTSTGGLSLISHRSGDTAGGQNAHSPSVGTQFELILKQGEQYVIQAQTFAATLVALNLFWHEDAHS